MLHAGKDVFVYYNNDVQGYAPDNARALAALLGQERERGTEVQPSLPL
jgi:uncharacterized protein YecE (DUF72 family)